MSKKKKSKWEYGEVTLESVGWNVGFVLSVMYVAVGLPGGGWYARLAFLSFVIVLATVIPKAIPFRLGEKTKRGRTQ